MLAVARLADRSDAATLGGCPRGWQGTTVKGDAAGVIVEQTSSKTRL